MTDMPNIAFCRAVARAPVSQIRGTVVALAVLAKVPVKVAERLMGSERSDLVLILFKAAALGWPIVKSVISVQPAGKRPSSQLISPSPITGGCRHRRLSAWCVFGKSARTNKFFSVQGFRKIRKQDARSARAALA